MCFGKLSQHWRRTMYIEIAWSLKFVRDWRHVWGKLMECTTTILSVETAQNPLGFSFRVQITLDLQVFKGLSNMFFGKLKQALQHWLWNKLFFGNRLVSFWRARKHALGNWSLHNIRFRELRRHIRVIKPQQLQVFRGLQKRCFGKL